MSNEQIKLEVAYGLPLSVVLSAEGLQATMVDVTGEWFAEAQQNVHKNFALYGWDYKDSTIVSPCGVYHSKEDVKEKLAKAHKEALKSL